MNAAMTRFLKSLTLGYPQSNGPLTVFPLRIGHEFGPDYLTLSTAMKNRKLKVKEVGADGVVTRLEIQNKAKLPVLILGGEEIRGGKQNRVLTTTVLIEAGNKLILPVSCTERDRWSRRPCRVQDSGNLLNRAARYLSMASVARSRYRNGGHDSDQRALWKQIEKTQRRLKQRSRTSALSDVYNSLRLDLDRRTSGLELLSRQVGILVLVNGKAAGLDLVSRPSAFADLHTKLLRSYLLDLMGCERPRRFIAVSYADAVREAKRFRETILECRETVFTALDLGQEWHYRGDGLLGIALAVGETVVHTSFFSHELEKGESMRQSGGESA